MQYDVDMASNHKELFLAAQALLTVSYSFNETRKPRITTYSDKNGGICHMRTMPHGIDFGFLKGVHMEDKLDLLKGAGKVMRILSLQTFNTENVEYYLKQAIEINSK